MRRTWGITILGILWAAHAAAALPPELIMADWEDGGFDMPRPYYGRYRIVDEAQLRQQIGGILQMQRFPGMDDWAWHGAVEDQLVALGRRDARALPLIWHEAESGRKGFELDALEVAA